MLAPKKARCGSVSSPNYITTTQQTCCQFVRTIVADLLATSCHVKIVCRIA